jgi:L-aspartate oxidase
LRTLEFDYIVVGSGLAGLIAAFHAADSGTVALISKSELDISNSYQAQGGIAAAIGKDDSAKHHFNDTITAGRGLCDHDAVDVLVSNGVKYTKDIIKLGMNFDRGDDGELTLGLEGGHSKRRILHAGGDTTGKMLTSFLLEKTLAKKNITPFEYTAAIRLIKSGNECAGLQTVNFIDGENIIFRAKATILATGGLSRLYSRSTNPHTATGDGIAMAWQAGVKVSDMEFIQFHPSALSIPGKEAFLISEAVRGEGAWLIDSNGERFMEKIHPLAELAPRDVVAAAIFEKIQETNKNVYLSLKHLNPESIRNRFKSIYSRLTDMGIDMTKDLIPVAPAAHYMMGGIRTDLWGQTNLPRLFACGEVASTGVMGANRLASNSLLECLVYGKRAVDKATLLKDTNLAFEDEKEIKLVETTDKEFLSVKNQLADLMNTKAGIVRNETQLKAALEEIESLYLKYKEPIKDYNHIKIKNLIDICRLITTSALERKESRGAHIRSDFPNESKQLESHIIQEKGKEIQYEFVRRNDL